MGVSDELIGPAREEQFRKVVGMAYKNRKAWRETNTLIIDEVSMISGYLFDDLDKIGRNVCIVPSRSFLYLSFSNLVVT